VAGGRIANLAPEKLFLLAATMAGLILVALIPPLAGGNEELNFQRAATIATGHALIEPVAVPGGIADLLDITHRTFAEGTKPPLHYSRAQFAEVAALKLRADQPKTIEPNPIAVLNPLSYLPQVPAIALGIAAGLPPLALFYLGRLAGLIAGLALTFFAIRIMPVHRHALAAVALLPPMLFSRSTLDADQITNGLAFLFLAMTFREIAARGKLQPAATGGLAAGAFLLAQAKSAYLLLPLQALAIPRERFGSRGGKALACALICVPGILASAAWMLALRSGYFTAIEYRTWSGIVKPDSQVQLVLANPLAYAGTLLHTIFGTAFIPEAIVGFLGVFGPPVMLPIALILTIGFLLVATVIADQGVTEPRLRSSATRLLAIAISVATFGLILTLLYVQWTRYAAPVIDGFSGRYLYPLVPLLLLFVPSLGKPVSRLGAQQWLAILAVVSAAATLWMTWATYFG
jgi:uncharacterized membrane protein